MSPCQAVKVHAGFAVFPKSTCQQYRCLLMVHLAVLQPTPRAVHSEFRSFALTS